jgi:hypothetical protein
LTTDNKKEKLCMKIHQFPIVRSAYMKFA